MNNIPDELIIIIKTNIDDQEEIFRYKPYMSKNMNSNSVLFNPLYKLDNKSIEKLNDDYKKNLFFKKNLFNSLILKEKPIQNLKEAVNRNYIDNNIKITLDNLFPDNFIPYDIANDFMIDLKEGDVLFTKDGKIGSTGMVVKNDLNLAVLSAGISRIRLKKNSIITPEFLFLALTIKEIGFYQADKKTVVASTLPHLKESQILNFIIPQLDKISTNKITDLIKKAFYKKNECKNLINNIRNLMDNYYSI